MQNNRQWIAHPLQLCGKTVDLIPLQVYHYEELKERAANPRPVCPFETGRIFASLFYFLSS